MAGNGEVCGVFGLRWWDSGYQVACLNITSSEVSGISNLFGWPLKTNVRLAGLASSGDFGS